LAKKILFYSKKSLLSGDQRITFFLKKLPKKYRFYFFDIILLQKVFVATNPICPKGIGHTRAIVKL